MHASLATASHLGSVVRSQSSGIRKNRTIGIGSVAASPRRVLDFLLGLCAAIGPGLCGWSSGKVLGSG